MKKSELKNLIGEEIRKVLKEGFQGDGDESGNGMSGFRGGSSSGVPSNLIMSPSQQLDAILRAWSRIGLAAKTSDDHKLGSALYTMLDKLGYQIIHKS